MPQVVCISHVLKLKISAVVSIVLVWITRKVAKKNPKTCGPIQWIAQVNSKRKAKTSQ